MRSRLHHLRILLRLARNLLQRIDQQIQLFLLSLSVGSIIIAPLTTSGKLTVYA